MRASSPPSALIPWHLASTALVVVIPGFLRFGSPFWNLSEGLAVQSPAMGVAYLSFAIMLMSREPRLGGASIVLAPAAGVACFGVVTLLMLAWPGFAWSRVLVVTAAGLGIPLGLLPHVFRSAWLLRLGPVAMGLAVAAGIAVPTSGPAPIPDRIVAAGSHTIQIMYHTGLVDQGPPTGGGIDTYRDYLLLSNSIGEISRIRWDGADPTVESLDLVLPLEINRNEFIEDVSAEAEDSNFRVMDLFVDTVSNPHRILLSHYVWYRDERCLTIRVSATTIPVAGRATSTPAWDTVFESTPCIPFSSTPGTRLTNHAGGRMALAPDGRVMLSVGDMLYRPMLAQEPDATYGKILLLDPGGGSELYSLGHRNPEGLMVARDGSVWASEHGPRGGDELNRILPGGNYGWPLATYGTAEDQRPSPLAEHRQDHGPFQEPAFTWVPSVGIANLIELSGAVFSDWRSDLLVASLNGRTLFRMRIREGRVVSAEEIGIGLRIRDLVQDPQGRVILYTDSGILVTLGRAAAESGEVAFAIRCSRCHEFQTGGQTMGPSLAGVFGRGAASLPDWPYSAALRDLDVVWNADNLDTFLTDPSAFAPGTTMGIDGLVESERTAIVEYLRTYQ